MTTTTQIFVFLFLLSVSSLFLTGFTLNERRSELPEFVILVQHTNDGLKLICETGCAWNELTFTINGRHRQAIDQNGMTSLSRGKTSSGDTTGGFIFTIEKTDNGFKCQGVKGTAWVKLSSECSIPGCKQYVGHRGTWERHKR